jgi:NTE family protein
MVPVRSVCLALQGGGALGAFTWGVLDALLGRGVELEAISGASAGAVNAVVLADGLLDGGPAQAREKLSRFWRKLSDIIFLGGSPAAQAAFGALDLLSVRPSPALLNPFGLNPLRDLLRQEIDFDRLQRESPIRLFIAATRVDDGSARIFRTEEVTLEVVLASACLPQFHDAVEIDGEAYWDGGYSANPPIMELVRATRSSDLLVVELTTPEPLGADAGGTQIERRLREFALGASLQRELDTLLDLQRMCVAEPAARSRLARRLRTLRVHRLSAQAHLPEAPGLNGLDLTWRGLSRLSESGAAAGERWIA